MNDLRQNTAATVKLGPFVDDTDAVTAETGLTIAAADVRLAKANGDFAAKAEASAATHDEQGYYDTPLGAADLNTLGPMRVAVRKTGALPVYRDFNVLAPDEYDRRYGVAKAATPLGESIYATNRYAAIARVSRASIGEDVTYTLTHTTVGQIGQKTETVVDDFPNDDDATFTANSTLFDVPIEYAFADLTLTAVPASGSSAVVQQFQLIEPLPEWGCVPRAFDSQHCWPTGIIWNDKLVQITTEAGRAKRHLSIDGRPAGEVFRNVPDIHREVDDRYHNGSALAIADGQLCCLMTDHNKRTYLQWGGTLSQLMGREPLAISEASETTTYLYADGQPEAGGSLCFITRNGSQLVFYEVSGLSTNSPTVTRDVFYEGSTLLPYLRFGRLAKTDDGGWLFVFGYQLRTPSAELLTQGVGAIELDSRLVYNARGQTNGVSAAGVDGAPKLASTLFESSNETLTNSLGLLGSNGGNTRYSMPFAVKVRDWGEAAKRLWVVIVACDTDTQTADARANTVWRVCSYNGVSRTVSTSGADPFGMDGEDSFRASAVVRWLHDDLSSTTAEVWIGGLESGFDVVDEYNQFGADARFRRFLVDTSGLSGTATDLDTQITAAGEIAVATDHAAEIREVGGSDGLIIHEAIEGTHFSEVEGASRQRYFDLPIALSDTQTRLASLQTTATAAQSAAVAVDQRFSEAVVEDIATAAQPRQTVYFNPTLAASGANLIYTPRLTLDGVRVAIVANRFAAAGDGIDFSTDLASVASGLDPEITIPGQAAIAAADVTISSTLVYNDNGVLREFPVAAAWKAADRLSVGIEQDNLASVVGSGSGGGTAATFPTDVEDADVPDSRTAVLYRSGAALRSRDPIYLRVGESGASAALCAASFRHDQAVGGRIGQVVAATVDGNPTGLTLEDVSEWKRDKQEARFLPNALAAGTYVVRVTVRYADGSGSAVGLVDIVVES